MAELGKAVEKEAAPSGTSGTEVISQKEADAVYEAELANDPPAPDDKGGDDKGADTGNEGDDAAPLKDDADVVAKAEAAKAEAEEQEFLKGLGMDPAKTPKELIPHLKKMHGEIGRLTNEVQRRGSQNKQVSEQYQAVKKELDAFKNQVNGTPEARLASLKERLGKIDIGKLPAATQALLKDDEYLMTWATMQTILEGGAPKQDAAPTGEADAAVGEDLPAEIKGEVLKAHPDYQTVYQSNEFAAWAQALPDDQKRAFAEKLKTAEGHNEVLAAFKQDFRKAVEASDKLIADEITKVHKDWKEKFAAPEFKAWIGKQSRAEQAKLRDTDPKGFIEVLNNFDAFLSAQKALVQREADRKKKNGALAGLGEVGGGGGMTDDLTDEDILNMPDAKFNEFDRKVATGGRK